jgi:4'-phosphopantetheinyl transferase
MLICRLPEQLTLACEQLRQNDVTVIGVDIKLVCTRDHARSQIREVVTEVIAVALNLTERNLRINSEKGMAPYVMISDGAQQKIVHLSIAYEDQFAWAVISRINRVGLDVVKIAEAFEWKDTAILYLGNATTQDISIKPLDQQFEFFLKAWASHEARLKCLGLGLQEWSEELEQQLSSIRCEVGYVSWDPTYIAAVARL